MSQRPYPDDTGPTLDAGTADAPQVYPASRIKRQRTRRTNAELRTIYDAMVRIVAADYPMTLRGLFYRLVSEGLVPKTEPEYEKVGSYLLKLRREGEIPYRSIADHTRWMRKPTTYDSMQHALHETVRSYRRSIWNDQPAYVEVWAEKDTLAGILMEETTPWDVPLMVIRGFSSETYVYEASKHIEAVGKPAYLYLLTDHDPSGLSSARHVERRIGQFLPNFPCIVERVAVTEEQIAAWHLPTRPTKEGDSRSKGFSGESVELDAIPPATLRELVRECIERHIDPAVLARTKDVERLERRTLVDLVKGGWAA